SRAPQREAQEQEVGYGWEEGQFKQRQARPLSDHWSLCEAVDRQESPEDDGQRESQEEVASLILRPPLGLPSRRRPHSIQFARTEEAPPHAARTGAALAAGRTEAGTGVHSAGRGGTSATPRLGERGFARRAHPPVRDRRGVHVD